jgi:hypothetical protein
MNEDEMNTGTEPVEVEIEIPPEKNFFLGPSIHLLIKFLE